MSEQKSGLFLYLMLGGIFISLLVTCNLIFQKFFVIDLFGYEIPVSVGLIPYPLTFLVTDLISEIYGRKRANHVVIVGLVCSVLVMTTVLIGDVVPTNEAYHGIDITKLDNPPPGLSMEEYHKAFGLAPVAVMASMLAYLCAQFIDIRIFHFWKALTKGKHLWLRNNFSTITSQLVDTTIVLSLLSYYEVLPWEMFWTYFAGSMTFKILVAAIDTPFFYLFPGIIKKRFGLGINDELKI